MDVIDLASRRAAATDTPDYAQCECGSAWFQLRRPTADGDAEPGVVAMSLEGSVTGYAGLPHCLECGREWIPASGWVTYP